MRIMAIQTARDETVSIMTAGTIKLRMTAGSSGHLPTDLGMTGEAFHTRGLDRIPERHHGLMRISMALHTVLDQKVRPVGMTGNTGGYGVFLFGGMPGMAVKATHFGGMSAARVRYCFLLEPVTLDTVFLLQLLLLSFHGKGSLYGHQYKKNQTPGFENACMDTLLFIEKNRFHTAIDKTADRSVTSTTRLSELWVH